LVFSLSFFTKNSFSLFLPQWAPSNFSLSRPPFHFPKTFFPSNDGQNEFSSLSIPTCRKHHKGEEGGKINWQDNTHSLSLTIPSCTTFFPLFLLFPFSTPFCHLSHDPRKSKIKKTKKNNLKFSHSLCHQAAELLSVLFSSACLIDEEQKLLEKKRFKFFQSFIFVLFLLFSLISTYKGSDSLSHVGEKQKI
jgi:hypothetical protein